MDCQGAQEKPEGGQGRPGNPKTAREVLLAFSLLLDLPGPSGSSWPFFALFPSFLELLTFLLALPKDPWSMMQVCELFKNIIYKSLFKSLLGDLACLFVCLFV